MPDVRVSGSGFAVALMATAAHLVSSRKASQFDQRLLLLLAVRSGADYGYLARRWLRRELGCVLARETVYSLLTELERDGYVASSLDGDVGDFPDEWRRRIYALTELGRDLLDGLRHVYGGLLF